MKEKNIRKYKMMKLKQLSSYNNNNNLKWTNINKQLGVPNTDVSPRIQFKYVDEDGLTIQFNNQSKKVTLSFCKRFEINFKIGKFEGRRIRRRRK